MKMFSAGDVKNILEDFLAIHFNFEYVCLSEDSQEKLKDILHKYDGVEVENIEEQY